MEYGSQPLGLVCNFITRTIAEEDFKNIVDTGRGTQRECIFSAIILGGGTSPWSMVLCL